MAEPLRNGHDAHVDGEALAEALAVRLREVVPSRYEIDSRLGDVAIWPKDAPDDWCAISVGRILDQVGDADYFIRSACYSVLDTAQDIITKDAAEPWPGSVPSTPGVAIEDGRIELWYGDRADPSLTLRSIDAGR
jgi:hypothetical protein